MKKMSRHALTLALVMLIASLLLSACTPAAPAPAPAPDGGDDPAPAPAPDAPAAPITLFMAKPEIASQFESMISDYNAKGNDVTLIPLTASQEVYEVMTSLYASGNAPTISQISQEFSEFQDKFLDLTDEAFTQAAGEGTLDFTTVDGRVYGVPATVEAYGVIYNPTVIADIFGADYDPTQIRTKDEFAAFLQTIEDAGVAPVHFTTVDWSVGAHLSNTVYTAQSADRATRHQFFEDLKAGSVSLADNEVFNEWVDFVDLLMKYNVNKDAPLAPVFEDGIMDLGTGKTAVWFMGNWTYPNLADVADNGYKFIPVPVGNDPDHYANGKIAIGVPSYWCVDKSQNDEAQQQAAVDFLNWFITTPEGQDYYVNQLSFIPAYSGFDVQPSDPMSQQVADLLNSGNSLEWMNNYYPAGGFQAMGVSIQKYIDGVIDRQGLATEFEDYWKSLN